MSEEELVELLADQAHVTWADWMRWLFALCVYNEDGAATIPPSLVARWQHQIQTPYADLSEREKQLDRDEARRALPIIQRYAHTQAVAQDRTR